MSKKRSLTSTSQPDQLTFYLDENIKRGIADELRKYSAWKIEVHRDHFPHSATGNDECVPDTEVIRKCGENGWVLVSSDDNMRRVPDNQAAAAAFKTRIFLFPSGNYKGGEYCAALVVGRFRLIQFATKYGGPFFARIGMDGKPSHLDKGRITSGLTGPQKMAAKQGSAVAIEESDAV
jgi:hypothetical protein